MAIAVPSKEMIYLKAARPKLQKTSLARFHSDLKSSGVAGNLEGERLAVVSNL